MPMWHRRRGPRRARFWLATWARPAPGLCYTSLASLNCTTPGRAPRLLPCRGSCNIGTATMPILFGIHAVEEALAARGRAFEYVAVAPGRSDARIQKITVLCRSAGV